MSHHSGTPFEQSSPEDLKKFMDAIGLHKSETKSEVKDLGPTGQYPDGKIASNDEGGLAFAGSILHGRIILDFGKPVHSIGFTKEEAIDLANYLYEKARLL